jgi:hypothetical protein
MTKIQTVQKFVAADGAEFDTREEARNHNKFAPRLAALEASAELDASGEFNADTLNKFLATNGDLLIKLLTPEPTKRAPRKAKEASEAVEA